MMILECHMTMELYNYDVIVEGRERYGKSVDIVCYVRFPSYRLTASSDDPGGERVNGGWGEGRGEGVLWAWPASGSAIWEESCLLYCIHEAATCESSEGTS
jgi:hypothetical protein